MDADATQGREGIREVGAGVDSLYLAYRVRVDWSVVGRMEALKVAAARARRAPTDPRTGEPLEQLERAYITLGDLDFEVRPYGASMAPYLLHASGWMDVAVAPDVQNGAPSVVVKVLAEALWREGTRRLVELADSMALAVGIPLEEGGRYVQRVDVALDFQGWTPRVSDFDLFSANGAPRGEVFPEDEPTEELLEAPRMWRRWKLTGFRFGRTSVVVRLYLKTQELLFSGKSWFYAVWARSGVFDASEPVWRLEVQFPRSYLKTVRTEGGESLETIEDVLVHLGPLWRTVLTERLRLTNGDATRLSRATTRVEWAALAASTAIDGCEDGSKVTKHEQDMITAEELVPKIRGYLAKFGALTGSDHLLDVVVDAHDRVRDMCALRAESFEQLVEKKRSARVRAEEDRRIMDGLAERTRAHRARENMRVGV